MDSEDHQTVAGEGIAARLLAWFDRHGRHDLPWQKAITPYRVWVSEIMLQQTQVGTVIPYFERFIARFPDVRTLAEAPEDELLHHWTGLGYYARARNLHRAARIVCERHGGEFPREREAIEALPGIGRSTAGAILAIGCGQRAAILDGNVKRVLGRLYAIDGDPAQAQTLARYWTIAEALTPVLRCADYTQAIMDLGATLCTRSRPACGICPLGDDCRARAEGNPSRYPGRKRRREAPLRESQLLVIRNASGEFLLQKRPPSGIWGGLWSFPQAEKDADPSAICTELLGETPKSLQPGMPFRHTLSHFHLELRPVHIAVADGGRQVLEAARLAWYKPGTRELGLAAPVKRLIDALAGSGNIQETEEP